MPPFKPKHVALYSLWAAEVSTAAHFYRDVVGLSLLPHHDQRPAFDLGNGSCLVILRGQPVPARNADPPHFPRMAFTVDDLDKAVEHLEVHRVGLPWGVENDENSHWVKFRDPAGNLIEFVQFFKLLHP